MHNHMEDIFLRIRKDGGSLTQEHITELNELIPETEKVFDSLFSLYIELDRTKKKIEKTVELFLPAVSQ